MLAQLLIAGTDDAANMALHGGAGGMSSLDKAGIGMQLGGEAAHWFIKGRYPFAGRIGAHAYEKFVQWNFGRVFSGAVKAGSWRPTAFYKAAMASNKWALAGTAASKIASIGNILSFATLAVSAGRGIGAGLSYAGMDRSRPNFSTPFMDTEVAYTQRQAALQAIHNSQLQTRSFFGREAEAFHR